MPADPTVGRLGLRERKKLQARQRIAGAAHDLFAAHGFEHVTMGDVAVAADVSVKTVFNYFGTKEDLAFEGEEQVLAVWIAAIRRRPAGTSPLAAIRALLAGQVDPALVARMSEFADLVAASPALQSRLRLLWDRLEEAVTRVLVAESAGFRGDAEPELLCTAAERVVAAQLVSLPRLFFSDDVRSYLAEGGELSTWLERAYAALEMPAGGTGRR